MYTLCTCPQSGLCIERSQWCHLNFIQNIVDFLTGVVLVENSTWFAAFVLTSGTLKLGSSSICSISSWIKGNWWKLWTFWTPASWPLVGALDICRGLLACGRCSPVTWQWIGDGSPQISPATVGPLASTGFSPKPSRLALSVARNGLYLDLPQLGAAEGRGFQLQQCLRGLGARARDPVAVLVSPCVTQTSKTIQQWKITIFNGKIHYKWPFSIVILVHQRVQYKV